MDFLLKLYDKDTQSTKGLRAEAGDQAIELDELEELLMCSLTCKQKW